MFSILIVAFGVIYHWKVDCLQMIVDLTSGESEAPAGGRHMTVQVMPFLGQTNFTGLQLFHTNITIGPNHCQIVDKSIP